MCIDDHLDALDGSKLVEELPHLVLRGVGIQPEDSNAAAGLGAILQRDDPRIKRLIRRKLDRLTYARLVHALAVAGCASGMVASSRWRHRVVRARTGAGAATRARAGMVTTVIVTQVRP